MSLAGNSRSVALPQGGKDCGLQVFVLFSGRRWALPSQEGFADIVGCHWGLRPPQRVYDGPIERPALEPWVADVPPLGGDPPEVHGRVQHLHDGLDLDHLSAKHVIGFIVGLDLPGQFGVKLGQRL